MSPTFDQFFQAIAAQESGGNYYVVNSYGAVGKYQILKSNIPSWSRQALGYSISWQAFRNSPALQDKIARYKLYQYWKAWGARGAAAAWYAGPGNHNLHMSTRRQPGGPSIKGYVDSVLRRAGGYPAYGGGGGGGYAGTVTPKLSKSELAESYGLSAALINSSSELKKLFNQAVSGSWSPARFQAALKNSKWWRTQSSTLRKYLTQKYTDPATFRQQQGATYAKLNALGIQVGLTNQLANGKPTALLKKVAYWSQALGWSDARIKDYLGGFVGTHDGAMWGEAGEAWDKLHSLAYTNGVSYSWQWYRDRSREIVAGKTTQETVEAKVRNAAAARYSAFRDQILAGQNVIDLAAPYIKSVSTLLELPETDVDVFNRHVQKAMTTKTTPSKEGGSQMPLWQFENEVRSDPLWKKTNNARENTMTVARQVLKDFGLAY